MSLNSPPPALAADGLSVRYGARLALDDLSFAVRAPTAATLWST
jgi:hypothetical protein